jgi:hypothetical protein
VRAPDPGPLTEDAVIAWVQGINALRLVLAERLEVGGDEHAEDAAITQAFAIADDADIDPDERDRARRIVHMWQVYELLGLMVAHAIRALG